MRHPDVHQHEVRLEPTDELQCLDPVGRFTEDLDVGLASEDGPEA